MITDTVMSAAFRAAGHETAGDKVFRMMREAILATGGANFDAAADQFIKRLLAEEDAGLVWEFMTEVRIHPVKKLFGVVRHLVREEQRAGQSSFETRPVGVGAAPGGEAGQRADETRTPTAPSPPVAPTVARPGLSTPVKSPPPPARTVPPPRGTTPTPALTDIARQSWLERFVVNGKPIGDLTRGEALSAKMREESDARFIALLIEQLPPGSNHRIRDYIKAQEADDYFTMAHQSSAA